MTFWRKAERTNADTEKEIGKCKSLTRKMNSPRFYYYSRKLSIAAVKMDKRKIQQQITQC